MEVSLRLMGFVLMIIRWLLKPFFFILSFRREVKKLPPLRSSLLTMSATQLAVKIRSGEVKSEEVVRAYITRIKEVNPYVNAVVEERFSAALEEARKVDELIASRKETEEQLQKEMPYLGVPITIKESCKLKGMSYCVGSLSRAGVKADSDGEAVRLLKKAGVIPLAVTTTPECCLSWETNNLVTGKTLNPYNPVTTSGGSSGGEGALLGAAASVIGLGSDIAGSIRIPSMFNGVFGHKPTPGHVSLSGHYPNSPDSEFSTYLVIGPLARYATDLRPLLKIMAGDGAASLRLDEKIDLRKMKIVYMEDAGFSLMNVQVDSEIRQRLRQAIKYLQERFAMPVQKGDFKDLGDSIEISCSLFFGMKGLPKVMQELFSPKVQSNIFGEVMKSFIGTSQHSLSALLFYFLISFNGFIPRHKVPQYRNQMITLRKQFQESLGDNGVFMYVTHPTPAFYHNNLYTMAAGILYAMIFNILGFPSTHVPLGLNKAGLPIGIQVVAAPHNDRLCLAVAEELEKGFGGWVPPPMAAS